ncbi:uncharacterized protein [Dysidea avara]|uniref:uncharacterized protein n=1 Tax=Dysidea avara TaxID=196820 RepID=UPI003325461A
MLIDFHNYTNEEFYNDIASSVQIHNEEILTERNEILQSSEDIEEARQQCSTSMGEDSSPAIVSMECHSDSTSMTSLTSRPLTKVTDIDFDNDNQVCVTDTKRRDVVSWDEVTSSDEDLTSSNEPTTTDDIKEGLEASQEMNEEFYNDIATSVQIHIEEILNEVLRRLEDIEEAQQQECNNKILSEGAKKCSTSMGEDSNPAIVSMECHSDSTPMTSLISSSLTKVTDIDFDNDNQVCVTDTKRCDVVSWDEVTSSDEDLRSSIEPTTTDDIKEGLEASQEINEGFYNDIETSVQIHTEEILNEVLQRLEDIEEAQQQCSTSMGEDNSPAIVSMKCHSDSTPMPSLITSGSLTKVTDINFDNDDQVCVTDTKRRDVVSWDEVMSSDEDLTSSNEPTTTDDIKEGLKASQEMNEEFYNDITASVKIHTEEILTERNEILQKLEDIEEAQQQSSTSMGEDSSPAIVSMECHSDSTPITSLTSSSLTKVTDIDFDNDNQVCVTDTKRRDVVSWDEVMSSDEDLTSSNEPTTTDDIKEGLEASQEMNEEFYNDIETSVQIHTEEILNEVLRRLEDIEESQQQCSTSMGEDSSPAIVSVECHSDSTPITSLTSSSLTKATDVDFDIDNQVCVTDTKRCDVVSCDEVTSSDEDLTSSNEPTTTDDIKEELEASQEMNEEFYNDIATSVQIHTEEILTERNEILQRLEDIEGAQQQCSTSMEEDSSPAIVSMECHSDSTSIYPSTSSSLTKVTDVDCVTDTKRCDVVSWDEVMSSDEDLTSSNEPTTTDDIKEGLEASQEMNEEFYNDVATSVQIHTEEILNERNRILRWLEDVEEAQQQCSTSMGEDSSPAIVSVECHSDSTPIPSSTSSSLTKVTDVDCATDTKRRDVVSWDEVMSSDEDLTSSNEPTKTDIFNEIMEGLQDALEMNEEFYNDIATSVQTHTKEILKEKNEILRRLEEIEGAEQQYSTSMGEDSSPAIVSMECHSDSTSMPSLITSGSLTKVTNVDFDNDNQVCVTDTKRRDVVSWDEVTSSDEDLTSSNEPTKTDICNEIMEGLQDALEMNEEFYNDIATSVKVHTEEILKERNEILQRLEEIEGAEQQRSTSMGEDSSPAIVSMECHSDSTPIPSLTSRFLTKVTDVDRVTDTKRRDVVAWNEVMSKDEHLPQTSSSQPM